MHEIRDRGHVRDRTRREAHVRERDESDVPVDGVGHHLRSERFDGIGPHHPQREAALSRESFDDVPVRREVLRVGDDDPPLWRASIAAAAHL